jgi:lantibiotic biosynthesis protein
VTAWPGLGQGGALPVSLGPGHVLRDAAIRIARSLCATARWDEGRRECNWLDHRDTGDSPTGPYPELRPGLYSGSAGVALFLGEASLVTGDAAVAQTAAGALRRSVAYLRRHSPAIYPLSVYGGHLGLLLVAVRLDELGLELGMEEDLAWLLDHAREHLGDPHPFDLIGGNAGAIPALHFIGSRFRGEECLGMASLLADELCRTATWAGPACSWTAEGFAGLPAMTGLSHGASGIAAALLRHYALTGEPRVLKVARGAFAFEDELYSPRERNWVDTRYPHAGHGPMLTGLFRRSYCHGAPGIALARAMASRLDLARGDQHQALARAAIDTTRAAVADALAEASHDATLCHGIAGLSEVLLGAGELLDDTNCRQLAEETANALIARYSGDDFPSEVSPSGGITPYLMAGTAGIGLHFLRLTTDAIMSPLFPGG